MRAAGIDNPRLEARLLLAHAVGKSQPDLLRDRAASVDAERLEPLLVRRLAHEPLALIVGQKEFWSLNFAVSPDTLVPRPETETLVEAALAAFEGCTPPASILDLGTGTGCLLLASLSEFASASGVGVDRVPAAAALAAHNSVILGLGERAAFVCGNWADSLDSRFDLVLCNPPYIPTSDLAGLMPDVADHEPRSALDGGPDGYAAYRQLIPDLSRLLTRSGIAVLELGRGQTGVVAGIARLAGFATETRDDLSGHERALVLRPTLP